MSSSNTIYQSPARRHGEMAAVAAFVLVSVLVPAFVGELYPFTISPMFRDQPEHYCTYKLFDQFGNELNREDYGLHLVYDGNPPGLGMGIAAPETLHAFGEVADQATIIEHLRAVTSAQADSPQEIHVEQTVVACDGVRPAEETRHITFFRNRPAAEGN